MKIFSYTFEEYVERVRTFHDFAAPGVVIGGFMIELVYQHLPGEALLKAICETPKCLPDAIQILTAKTIGNGRLTIINLGRFALTFYDMSTGEGIRVSLDQSKIEALPEIKDWLFKLNRRRSKTIRFSWNRSGKPERIFAVSHTSGLLLGSWRKIVEVASSFVQCVTRLIRLRTARSASAVRVNRLM